MNIPDAARVMKKSRLDDDDESVSILSHVTNSSLGLNGGVLSTRRRSSSFEECNRVQLQQLLVKMVLLVRASDAHAIFLHACEWKADAEPNRIRTVNDIKDFILRDCNDSFCTQSDVDLRVLSAYC